MMLLSPVIINLERIIRKDGRAPVSTISRLPNGCKSNAVLTPTTPIYISEVVYMRNHDGRSQLPSTQNFLLLRSGLTGCLIPLIFTPVAEQNVDSGGLEFTNFPSEEGVTPKSQTVVVPNPYNRPTGEVCSLEWTSDGYVLAVGWKYGWGIFSVGGRCLASGFGINESIDETK
jgi:hypothetical protein